MTAEPCNCLFEDGGTTQVMWCPLHLRLRDELQSKEESIEKLLPLAKAIGKLNAELLLKDEEIERFNVELLRVAKDMDEQCRTNVRLRSELKNMGEDIKLARLYLAQIPTVGSAVAADKALQAAQGEEQ